MTLPTPVRALLQVLSGAPPDPSLDDAGWEALRQLADRTHCTLYCGLGGSAVQDNAERRRRMWAAYDQAAAVLFRHGIEYVLLKGFTHEVDFGIDPALRYQSDLDFLCRPGDLPAARDALQSLGYRPHGSAELSANHSRPLVKPSAWQWTGNYFDPRLPISIELHHTLWSGGRDRIPAPGIDEFWNRCTLLPIEGRQIPALAEPDRVAFAALHVLRHILRNNASPSHAFELAGALHQRAQDESFWESWVRSHPPELRALQTVAFQFAHRWFDCELSPAAEREWLELPETVRAWFQDCAFSPLANLLEPNKDALWLHLALVRRRRDRFRLGFRGLLPLRIPRSEEGASLIGRTRYHAVALARTLFRGSRRRRTAVSAASQTSD